MKRYEDYKDSGIEWIGEIPIEWNLDNLGWQGNFSSSGIDKKLIDTEPIAKMINYTDIYGNKSYSLLRNNNFMEVTCPENKL